MLRRLAQPVLTLALALALAPAARAAPVADPALARRCAGGELEACTRALQQLVAAREAPKVKARLPDLLRRCDQGTAAACASAAQAYAFPDPSVRDDERSAKLARRACDLGAP